VLTARRRKALPNSATGLSKQPDTARAQRSAFWASTSSTQPFLRISRTSDLNFSRLDGSLPSRACGDAV
jgi:hypothetical protein